MGVVPTRPSVGGRHVMTVNSAAGREAMPGVHVEKNSPSTGS